MFRNRKITLLILALASVLTVEVAEADYTLGTPTNLGPTVNSSDWDGGPNISADGLMLFFDRQRLGGQTVWVTTRETIEDNWGEPVELGPVVNTIASDGAQWQPSISSDGQTLFFMSNRPGGSGDMDLWQVSIEPVVDLNDDGIVDAADMCIIIDNWGTDEVLCDIGPTPFVDGIVDVQDLIVLAEHLFEEIPLVEPVE